MAKIFPSLRTSLNKPVPPPEPTTYTIDLEDTGESLMPTPAGPRLESVKLEETPDASPTPVQCPECELLRRLLRAVPEATRNGATKISELEKAILSIRQA